MKNKHMKKWMLILAIALCLNAVAFAEGEEPAAPAAPAQVEQVKEEKKAEAPKPAEEEKKVEAEKPAEPEVKAEAEKPAEPAPAPQAEAAAPAVEAAAPTEEVTAAVEAPAESAAPAEVEAPAEPEAEAPAADAEQTEAPAEETEVASEETAEAPAEDGTVEIDDYETPLGVTPDAAPAPFDASVQLQMRNQGEIFYGDTVTLEANVTGATGAYDIRWEVDRHDDLGWSTIAGQSGSSYGFVITENNASYDYRVVVTGQA